MNIAAYAYRVLRRTQLNDFTSLVHLSVERVTDLSFFFDAIIYLYGQVCSHSGFGALDCMCIKHTQRWRHPQSRMRPWP